MILKTCTDDLNQFRQALYQMFPHRADTLSLLDSYHAYGQRYNIEHFFCFGKQKILLTHFQTPEKEREEN
jgi:hypothetical protein